MTRTAERYVPEAADLDELRAAATIHPSAVLRSDDRDAAYAGFAADLAVAAAALTD